MIGYGNWKHILGAFSFQNSVFNDIFVIKPTYLVTMFDKFSDFFFFFLDNYSKPTCGLTCFHFAYPWFKTLHFAHLSLFSLGLYYPPLAFLLENNFYYQNIT